MERAPKLLLALQRYYLEDISFGRAAGDAGVTLSELIDFLAENDLPLVYEEADVVEGVRRVSELLERRGVESALGFARSRLSFQ